MLTYAQYKQKHEWATQSIATFEGRLADGKARLSATRDELKIAENDHNAAAKACLEKPTTEVTAGEWAKFEGSYQRVTDLRDQCDAIEKDNGVSEKGIDEAQKFRSELEAQNPEHHEQQLSERSQEPPDSSDMSKTAKGFQAYAGIAAVVVNLNASDPQIPSDIQSVHKIDPAAREKQELGELSFEDMPSSRRDQIRRDSQPPESSPYEPASPGGPVETSNDPRLSYSAPVPQEYGETSAPEQQPAQPLEGPKDAEIPAATSGTDTPLLTYDKADQKLLTYEEPKLITDQRANKEPTTELAPPSEPTETQAPEAQVTASAPPAPDESVPEPAQPQPEQQPTGPGL